MDFTIEAVEFPESNAARFLATDTETGLTATGATPQRADLNLQVVIRRADLDVAEASYATLAGREAAATAHNAKAADRGRGNAGRP